MVDIKQNNKSSDIPTPMAGDLGLSALHIKTTCKDCIHLKRIANSTYKKPCIDLGIFETSKPCQKFSVNPENIKFNESKQVRRLAHAISECSDREITSLAILLNQEKRTRRYGFKFGEQVYFKLYGGEFLKNYVVARVYWADSKVVHVQGIDGYIATLQHRSVLKQSQWNKLEFKLIRDGKIHDPSRARYEKAPTKAQLELQKIEKPLPLDLSASMDGKGSLVTAASKKKVALRTMSLDKFLTVR